MDQAIIYKITSPDESEIYVGSTTKKYLSLRKANHKYTYAHQRKSNCASFKLFDKYGFDKCIFKEIERCPKEEQYQRERYWYENLEVVNYKRPFRTPEEKKIYKREWAKKKRESSK
jgi:hypothetical protein